MGKWYERMLLALTAILTTLTVFFIYYYWVNYA